MSISLRLKGLLLRTGRHLAPQTLARARSALGYLEIGALTRRQLGDASVPLVSDRFDVFAVACARVSGAAPLYLEFGVFEGETMRWWSSHLDAPGARMVGFDSFEGLPESWRPDHGAGEFRTAGPPRISDPRVEFVVGWFSETLPHFALPPHDQLIVNVDCDLYSSAKTVLEWARPHLVRGSLLYFDELADRDHELRALSEILEATDLELKPLAAGGGGAHFLFEVVDTLSTGT